MNRLLGLDWGEKRIGVAISDDKQLLAVGYDIWPAESAEFFTKLRKAQREEQIESIVVGYPLTVRGEVGPKAREVDRFITKLETEGYTVIRADERYTSFEAGRSLSRLGISQRKQRGRLDMSAAVLMLQSYLDSRRVQRENSSP